MNVICPQCNATYHFAEDRIPDRRATFPCKRCGKRIVVEPQAAAGGLMPHPKKLKGLRNVLRSQLKEQRNDVKQRVGDCLGSIWEPPMLGRRIGQAYYLDFPYVGEDLVTFGLIQRPWDDLRFGPSGPVFAYYDVEHFVPEDWRPGYPNPAFGRMSERDAAWMARIIAKFSDEHLRAVIAQAKLNDEFLERELFRLLKGRQTKVLKRYLAELSPLAHPQLKPLPVPAPTPATASSATRQSVTSTSATEHLCVTDLAVQSSVVSANARVYGSRLWSTSPVRDRNSASSPKASSGASVLRRSPLSAVACRCAPAR